MIKYIPISQDAGLVTAFSWYHTGKSQFLSFSGNQVWQEWKHFENDWRTTPLPKPPLDWFREAKNYYTGGTDD